jgi:hypothetical protein
MTLTSIIFDCESVFQPPTQLLYQAHQVLLCCTSLDHVFSPVSKKTHVFVQDFRTSIRTNEDVFPTFPRPVLPLLLQNCCGVSFHACQLIPLLWILISLCNFLHLKQHFSPAKTPFMDTTTITMTFATILVPRSVEVRFDFLLDDPASCQDSGLSWPDCPDYRVNESRNFIPTASDDRPKSSSTLSTLEDLQVLLQSVHYDLDKHVKGWLGFGNHHYMQFFIHH